MESQSPKGGWDFLLLSRDTLLQKLFLKALPLGVWSFCSVSQPSISTALKGIFMDSQDREPIIFKVEQLLRNFQGCSLKEAEHFFSLDSLNEYILENSGLILSRLELIESLDKLNFIYVNADGQRVYPMKVLS